LSVVAIESLGKFVSIHFSCSSKLWVLDSVGIPL